MCAQGVTEEQAIENLDATIHIHEALDSESGAQPLADVKRVAPAIFERLYQPSRSRVHRGGCTRRATW